MPGVRLHRVVLFLLGLYLYLPGITMPAWAQSGNPPPADEVFALTVKRAAEGGLQLLGASRRVITSTATRAS